MASPPEMEHGGGRNRLQIVPKECGRIRRFFNAPYELEFGCPFKEQPPVSASPVTPAFTQRDIQILVVQLTAQLELVEKASAKEEILVGAVQPETVSEKARLEFELQEQRALLDE